MTGGCDSSEVRSTCKLTMTWLVREVEGGGKRFCQPLDNWWGNLSILENVHRAFAAVVRFLSLIVSMPGNFWSD